MEWWQQLILSLVTILFGVFLGYFLSRIGAKQERKSRTEEQLRNAGRSILAELKINLEIAQQPFQNILVPFVTRAWEAYKGEILGLPKDLQDTLYQVYDVEIQIANALVDANLRLPYGLGYYNRPYQDKCKEIAEKAEKARELLRSWLNKRE